MTDQENIEAQVLDAREKFGTSRISDAADQALAVSIPPALHADPEIRRELFIAGSRAMLESIIQAHHLSMKYPHHSEVFRGLMESLKNELDEHVVDLLSEILDLVKRASK